MFRRPTSSAASLLFWFRVVRLASETPAPSMLESPPRGPSVAGAACIGYAGTSLACHVVVLNYKVVCVAGVSGAKDTSRMALTCHVAHMQAQGAVRCCSGEVHRGCAQFRCFFFVGPPRLAFQRKGPCLRRVGWCSRVGATLWTRARGWWSLRLPVGLRLRGIHCMLQHVVEFMRALQNSTHTRTLRAPNSAMPPASWPCLLCEHPRATCTLSSAPMIAHRLD